MSGPADNAFRGAATTATESARPAQPLIAPTGNAPLDVLFGDVDRAASPFQNLSSQDASGLDEANDVVGGILGAVFTPLNLLNDGFALATAGIAELFPPLPAATLGMLHLGLPHEHPHPPAMPEPLPSFGPVVLAGSVSVLVNGLPAARAGDIGIALTCGTLAPPFEVFTGSSKVFIGGARAARMLDITKHCQPGGGEEAAGLLQKAMQIGGEALGVVGVLSEGLNALAQASDAGAHTAKANQDAATAKAAKAKAAALHEAARKAAAAVDATAAAASGNVAAAAQTAAQRVMSQVSPSSSFDAQADAADTAADAADAAAAAEAAKEAAALAAAQAAANAAAEAEDAAEDAEASAEADEQAEEDAAATASASAASAATQAVLDAAAMALASLMGTDPGEPPCYGLLLSGMPNVLVGGFPMPPWMAVARGLGKLAKLGIRTRTESKGEEPPEHGENLECDGVGEPVDPVTGANVDDWIDYEAEGEIAFRWGRRYTSAHADRGGPMGRGFRHTYERTLHVDLDFATYTDEKGRPIEIPIPARDETVCRGYTLRVFEEEARVVYTLDRTGEPTMEFVRDRRAGHEPRLTRLVTTDAQTRFSYDAEGRLSGMLDTSAAGEIETRLSLDPSGHVVAVRRGPRGARELPLVAAYAYDAAGCLVAFQDALGARSAYAYDAAGRMTQKIDPSGYGFHYAYDDLGRCVESHGSDGRFRVALAYDRAARRTTVTEVDGGAWVFEYDGAGTITSIVDPYGGERRRELDEGGRVVREVGPGPHDLRFLYDPTGKHYAIEDRFGRVRPPIDDQPRPPRDSDALRVPETPWEQQWGAALGTAGHEAGAAPPEIRRDRDALGRVTEEVDAQGRRRSFVYDAAGKLARWTDRDGRKQQVERASWNQVRATVDPLGHRTSYDYTMRSEVARVVDPGGSESRYEHDLKDRLVRVVRHGVVREQYVYDEGDGLVEKRDGAGNVLVRRTLDAKTGLPVERRLATGEVYRYEHDARGRPTRIRSKGEDVRREHDARGRLLRDERDGRGVRHRFFGAVLAETTYFGRFVVRRSRRPDGALLVEAPAGGVTRLRREAGGILVADLGNGTRVTSTYDDEGRCLGRDLSRAANSGRVIWSVRYTYSAEGDLLRVEDSARGAIDYAVDHAHRLVGEKRPGGALRPIVLDAAGNVLSKANLPPVELFEGNRLRAAGGERFGYDERNHLEEHRAESGASVRYRYDANDMLVEVAWSDRRELWTAAYDGLRRRTYKALGGARTEQYWDDHRLAAEVGPGGALRLYVYPDATALVPLMFVDYDSVDADPASGKAYYPIGNQIGVPLHVEDQEGRAAWWADHVDPYGTISVRAGATIAYALRFPGHFWDEETGLHYNRFRYYSPRLGRYLQSDPIGQAGGINLYAYAANPLVQVDVLGLDAEHRGKGEEGTAGTDGEAKPSAAERLRAIREKAAAESARKEAARKQYEAELADWNREVNRISHEAEDVSLEAHRQDPELDPDKSFIVGEGNLQAHLGRPGEEGNKMPEFGYWRKDGTFVTVEVKNQTQPDSDHAVSKFTNVDNLANTPVTEGGPPREPKPSFVLEIPDWWSGKFGNPNHSIVNGTLCEHGEPVIINGKTIQVVERPFPTLPPMPTGPGG